MSRIAKYPVTLPAGVEVNIQGQEVSAKGPKGELKMTIHRLVQVIKDENALRFETVEDLQSLNTSKRTVGVKSSAIAGTTRALVNNMVTGVSTGFTGKLQLVGVGYRAAVKGSELSLTLGFSHPVSYPIPKGVTIATPSPTEIEVSSADKQLLGQVMAEIRQFRPPEPYKGKGVRYANEVIILKETKKK